MTISLRYFFQPTLLFHTSQILETLEYNNQNWAVLLRSPFLIDSRSFLILICGVWSIVRSVKTEDDSFSSLPGTAGLTVTKNLVRRRRSKVMRSCKCTCVCLGVIHNDAILLGVTLTKVFLACATTSPGQVASHSKDPLWFPKTCLSYDCSSRTFAQPMMEILFSEAAFRADGSFRWVESMKILSERRVVAAS